MDALLVEALRGELVESRHLGRAVVVDDRGVVLFAAGDVEAPVFTRWSRAVPPTGWNCRRPSWR